MLSILDRVVISVTIHKKWFLRCNNYLVMIFSRQISESLPLFPVSSMGGGMLGTVFLMEVEVRYPATPGAAQRAGLLGRSGKKRSCFCCSYCCHTGLAFRSDVTSSPWSREWVMAFKALTIKALVAEGLVWSLRGESRRANKSGTRSHCKACKNVFWFTGNP